MKKMQLFCRWAFLVMVLVLLYSLGCMIERNLITNYYEGFYLNDVDTPIDSLSEQWTTESQIPNMIWTFWDGEMSPFVTRCIQSWKDYNPGYKVIVLNKQTLGTYLPEVDFSKIRAANDFVQRYSDYVRIYVLSKYGGFWFDASIICQKSNQWIHEIQRKTNAEFIGFYIDLFTLSDYRKTSPILENWCFACVPRSIFVQDWLDEFMRLNDHENAKQYIDAVVSSGVNLQNLDHIEYLVMHVSAQKVLQSNPPNKYRLHFIRAEDTAFRHLVNDEGGWDGDENGARRILEKTHSDQPLLKLIAPIRKQVEDECAKQDINIEELF